MRSLLLASLVVSAGCMIVPPHAYVRAPGAPPPSGAAYAPAPAARYLSQDEAVSIASQYAASQGMRVDRVKHANLDGEGRWHVDLRGHGKEKAKVLVDARTGRVLDAKLKAGKHGRDDDDRDDD